MLRTEILSRFKAHVFREVVAPIRKPYMHPVYRHFWSSKSGETVATVIEPLKRRQDRVFFAKQVRPTDVFLIGHPKSGNTWMAYMLAKLLRGDRSIEVTMANIGSYVPVIHGQDSAIGKHVKLHNPRVFRNEYPVHPQLYPKIVYLVRDPRSVLVSYYHMYCVVHPEAPMTLRGFVEEYLANGFIKKFEPLVRWDRQVSNWHKRAQVDPTVLIVRYEDMVQDRAGTLERVAKFAGIPYSAPQFAAVVEQSSFAAMKRDEQVHGAESYLNVKEQRGNFIRRGKTDGWKEELAPDLVAQVESAFASVMQTFGYVRSETLASR